MEKSYCNLCWAKGGDGRCLCGKESRLEHCRRARMRADTKVITNNKELIGLRDYIAYISQRITYLKIFDSSNYSNEYKYLCLLRKKIKQWGEEHIIFYKYLRGEITIEQCKALYGMSYRQVYRMSTQQRKDLIVFIKEQENLLSGEYPFIPTDDFIHSVVRADQ